MQIVRDADINNIDLKVCKLINPSKLLLLSISLPIFRTPQFKLNNKMGKKNNYCLM